MTFEEAITYLYARLPVFHRVGAKALKPGLDNTLRLCAAIGNPHDRFPSIHVAGTNGKGSTSHMLASVYQAAGYRVGLYTSPHLKSFTERIRLNGQSIPEETVARYVTALQSVIDEVEPSFFEVTVALAFQYFAEEAVDLAIVEVGLGGRLDSTNIITPRLSIITNIGYDHMDVLGDTLPQIASEKAGIIKPGVPVLIGETQPEVASVFLNKANDVGADIEFSDQLVNANVKSISKLRRVVELVGEEGSVTYQLDLLGQYQAKNVVPVVRAVARLQGQFPVSQSAVTEGLANVIDRTGLKGRFQVLRHQPLTIADAAHNLPGIQALFATVTEMKYETLRIVFGMVADKDPRAVIAQLPENATYYLCQAQIPRALPVDSLEQYVAERGLTYQTASNVNKALALATAEAAPNDLLLICGSTYVVAELDIL